ncbi:HAD family hydrolase [Microbispora sp. NBC_01389]|uniref:HAD family hydrolase n=1 Tax=Microbispora sp. NBC_01389 TaxID=2903584 RepID=UPI00324DC091
MTPLGKDRETVSAASRTAVAFFDADETLVRMKSPFALLRHHLGLRGDDGTAYERLVEPLRRHARQGGAPAEVSAMYYRLLAGVPLAQLIEEGRDWYATLCRTGVPYVAATLEALRRHQEAGHVIAVISGAWCASLRPITDDLGVETVLCTEPAVDEAGRLTGEVDRVMFGPAKAAAVHEVLDRFGARAEDCFAYADDPGDLPMLSLVGRPTVIGGHPRMAELAARHGWGRLPNTVVDGGRPVPV